MNTDKLPLSMAAIRLVADMCGATVRECQAPLIGDYIVIHRPDGSARRICSEPDIPAPLVAAYEQPAEGPEAQQITSIYIGSRYHGPLLQWSRGRWHNCYSHGNFGKKYACGGTWGGDSREGYASIGEALAARRVRVAGNDPLYERARLTEGEALYKALAALEG